MIIFDTCILRGCGLESSSADLLRAIRESGVGVAAPWMVVEELAGQQVAKYLKQHDAAAQALGSLRSVTPWQMEPVLEACAPEEVRGYWRKKYADFVGTIPTSEAALREAMRREISGLPPAKAEKQGKTGGRDAAIWLSAVEYARNNPEETVYFVSSNTKDFGDGTVYEYPMFEDVEELGDRFALLTSLDQVVERFTREVQVDPEAVKAAVLAKGSERALGRQIHDLLADSAQAGFEASLFDATGGERSWTWLRNWKFAPFVQVESIEDIKAYAIGDEIWSTATAQVTTAGLNMALGASGTIACSMQVPLLIGLQHDRAPVALRIKAAGPLDAADGARAVEMARNQVRALTEIERRLLLHPWERELPS
ncbi:PIN domain-containing protein [Streptomyces sp. NPDC006197]|uniref:PIN domain-containing protein n=1 Tax=Streptomyces sp. NPDC006197 TaxID=3156685 RepID=UPI0033A4955E